MALERIRLACEGDAVALPAIERSAGELFRAIADLAWVADDDDQSVERHRDLIGKGACRVAVDGSDRPVAFLSAEILGDELHIWEFAVRRDRQGRGIGRALLEEAVADARARGLAALTLTTFRDVAWNQPFYARLGFRTLDAADIGERLGNVLRREAEHGLPEARRCAMRLSLD